MMSHDWIKLERRLCYKVLKGSLPLPLRLQIILRIKTGKGETSLSMKRLLAFTIIFTYTSKL